MFYAIKTIDQKQVNLILTDWNECRKAVINKSCEFSGFETRPEAEAYLRSSNTCFVPAENNLPPEDIDRKSFTGTFERKRISFDNGYMVATYKTENDTPILCNGYNLPDNKKATFLFYGSYQKTKKYGWQFSITSFEEVIGNTEDSIVNYLSCGIIKGIGKKKAKEIYARFREDTMRIFDEQPEKLLEIPGIKMATYEKIKSSYKKNKGARELAQYLIQFNISQKHAAALYKKYGAFSLEKIRANPYILCYQRGITFPDADRVAKYEKLPLDSDARFEACANYVLLNNEQTGSTGMEINQFGYEVWRILNGYTGYDHDDSLSLLSKSAVNQKTVAMIQKRQLRYLFVDGKHAVFTKSMCAVEASIADNLRRLNAKANESLEWKKKINKALSCCMEAESIKLDELQSSAIYMAILKSIIIIYGAPGTGKTTTLNILSATYHRLFPNNDCIYLAPTGRAAREMEESVGEEAHTIHSYLRIIDDVQMEEEAVLIQNSLVVVDEFSMVDARVANILFSSIGKNCHVVLVGDIDQLESVGAGAVMRDILGAGFLPAFMLQTVYRQGEHTMLRENIQKIKKGNTNILDGSDFHFYECSDMEQIRNRMADDYIDAVRKYGLLNVMCLCPFIRHAAGVEDMNTLLQQRLNPFSLEKQQLTRFGTTFREQDVVMYVGHNTWDTANGDIGIIEQIRTDEEESVIEVNINKRTIAYKGEDIADLTLAYAMTVHKSQGSEADAVITCISEFHGEMLYRSIPYVAISRGKKQVSVYGQRSAFNKAVTNKKKARRITSLGYYLALESGEFVAM